MNANEVIGRRLKLKRSVIGYIGYVGSQNRIAWDAGFITPPVYSWVEDNGNLYWMFWSEIQGDPTYYFLQAPGNYELLAPDYSGAPSGSGNDPFIDLVMGNVGSGVSKLVNAAILIGAGYFLIKALK